jgi:hypothetical protein
MAFDEVRESPHELGAMLAAGPLTNRIVHLSTP